MTGLKPLKSSKKASITGQKKKAGLPDPADHPLVTAILSRHINENGDQLDEVSVSADTNDEATITALVKAVAEAANASWSADKNASGDEMATRRLRASLRRVPTAAQNVLSSSYDADEVSEDDEDDIFDDEEMEDDDEVLEEGEDEDDTMSDDDESEDDENGNQEDGPTASASAAAAAAAAAHTLYDGKFPPYVTADHWEYLDEVTREAVFTAIRFGDLPIVKILVSSGATISGPTRAEGGTALHIAAQFGRTEILKYLLDGVGSTNSLRPFVNDGERTDAKSKPLHWAAIHGKSDACEALITVGNCQKNRRNDVKYAAIHMALSQGHEDTVHTLLKLGCNPNVPNEDGHTLVHMVVGDWFNEDLARDLINGGLAKQQCDLEAADVVGWTPLAMAVDGGHTAIVELLLSKGVKLAYPSLEESAGMVVKSSVANDSDDEEGEDEEDDMVDLPLLHTAIRDNKLDIAKLMLKARSAEISKTITQKDALGKTAEDWAALSGDAEIMALVKGLPNGGAKKREREE